MSKDKLTDYSATNSLNTDVGGVNIDEGMLPSDVNNALREVMTHLKDFAEGTQAVNNIRFAGATTTGDINFGDNNKAVFGAGSDLQIYHDGTHSYVKDAGTGNLYIQGTNLRLGYANGEFAMIAGENGSVEILHDNATKIATTATGVDITGTLTADGLTVDGASTFVNFTSSNNSAYVRLQNSVATGGYIGYQNDDLQLWANASYKGFMLDGATNDISFYDSTGTTQGFYWDASTQRLGLGTTGPSAALTVSGSLGTNWAGRFENTSASGYGVLAITAASTASEKAFEVRKNTSDTAMVINGAGSVGIGQSSPDAELHIGDGSGASDNTRLRLTGGTSGQSTIQFGDTASANIGQIQYDHSSNDLVFRVNTAERMRIDNSGNVGIGTASPSGGVQLDVRGTGVLQLVNTDTVQLVASNGGSTLKNVSNNPLLFGTNNTERMRLDSSGNLLVGTTTTALATNQGTNIAANGGVFATKDSNAAITAGRLTTDGDIAVFRKDGTAVGSIGTSNGTTFIAGDISGVRLGGTAFMPSTTAGANKDALVDIGSSAVRWKHLHLSGGIYLGGSGAANYLNDYEEGTWTPVPTSTGATFSTSAAGKYTKVGNLVFISMYLDNSSAPTGTLTNTMNIYGLPFANNSGGFGCVLTVGFLNFVDAPASKYQIAARVANGASYITPEWFQDDSVVTNMTAQDFDYSDARLVITGHYYTDS